MSIYLLDGNALASFDASGTPQLSLYLQQNSLLSTSGLAIVSVAKSTNNGTIAHVGLIFSQTYILVIDAITGAKIAAVQFLNMCPPSAGDGNSIDETTIAVVGADIFFVDSFCLYKFTPFPTNDSHVAMLTAVQVGSISPRANPVWSEDSSVVALMIIKGTVVGVNSKEMTVAWKTDAIRQAVYGASSSLTLLPSSTSRRVQGNLSANSFWWLQCTMCLRCVSQVVKLFGSIRTHCQFWL